MTMRFESRISGLLFKGLWDYHEWYDRRSVWLQLVLFPVLFLVTLLHFYLVALILLVIWPFLLVEGWLENRRFWQSLRDRGQVVQWPEVESKVSSGSGTLVVEVTPNDDDFAWLIDLPRDQVDPEHVVPSWQQFEELGWDVFVSPATALESMNRWAIERLGAYETSARALIPSSRQLDALGDEARQRAVLAVPCWYWGRLTRRLRDAIL